jgi:AcrR family transcriptional regulator
VSVKTGRGRRRDAEANVARVRDAALRLLAGGSDPSMAEIAAAAGVSRQTVYSHYPSREALYDALVGHLTAETAARLAADELPADPVAGLEEWLTRAWGLIDAYPALLSPALVAHAAADGTDPVDAHEPILGGLRSVLDAAADAGVLAGDASPEWLVSAVIALGHAAGSEVAAGRMPPDEAGRAFRAGAIRLCLRPAYPSTPP